MKNKKLIIIGAGETANLAYEYFTHDSEYEVVAFSVNKDYLKETTFKGLPVVEYENIDNITWETLYNVKTQPSSEKTLFHVEYDAINTDSTRLSQVLSSKTDDLMGGVEKVRYWDKRILSLLKQSK